MVPLLNQRLTPLPGASARGLFHGSEPHLDSLLSLPAYMLQALTLEDGEVRQKQQLVDAALKVEGEAGPGLTLGKALESLACSVRDGRCLPVVDTAALEEVGLYPTTPLPPRPALAGTAAPTPFWTGLGLVLLPSRGVPLLTTPAQQESWQTARSGAVFLPPSIEAAVEEAALNGYDASGRFRRVEHWTRRHAQRRREETALSSILMPASVFDQPGWTEWEPIGGRPSGDGIIVVSGTAVLAGGLSLAGLLLVGFWQLRGRSNRCRLLFLLGWLATAGLATLWLPTGLQALAWWPLLLGTFLGLCWYVWSCARRCAAPPFLPRGPLTAVRWSPVPWPCWLPGE